MKRENIPVDAQQAVIDELHGLVAPADVRRVFAALGEVVPHHVRQGRTVRLPGVVRLKPQALKQRRFRSNLPHLRGQTYVSRPRWKLSFESEGLLAIVLRQRWTKPRRRSATMRAP
ncbi:MAG: hypothetical protein ACOC9P_02100 [bacterium]